ncbi:MAG: DUF2922 domain-containing protein, partial [Defluviitaleaceae bacterium]|nr:DUF2922 domain-containing protein [Defluviitaleaceae bacterium]
QFATDTDKTVTLGLNDAKTGLPKTVINDFLGQMISSGALNGKNGAVNRVRKGELIRLETEILI